MSRPRSTVGEHDFAASVDTSDPLPIATPMSACPRVRRARTRAMWQPGEQFGVGESLDFGSGDDTSAKAEIVSDRSGGDGVVPGNHSNVDAGVECSVSGLLGLRAKWIHDSDDCDEDMGSYGGHWISLSNGHCGVLEIPNREGEHPMTAFGQPPIVG